MKTKKALSLLLAIVMVLSSLSALSLCSFAQSVTSGDFVYETLGGDKAEIINYKGTDENVVIPSEIDGNTVVKISGFKAKKVIKSVVVPDTVDTVGDNAFLDCVNLESIVLPDKPLCIGCDVLKNTALFKNSDSWQDGLFYVGKHVLDFKKDEVPAVVTIKDGTLSIAEYAIYQCPNLETLIFPESIEYINQYAVQDCDKLKTVELPHKKLTYIDGTSIYSGYFFNENNENGAVYLGDYLFQAEFNEPCTFSIKEGTKYIASYSVISYDRVNVIIPESVEEIMENAFEDAHLGTATILSKNLIIRESAFYNSYLDGDKGEVDKNNTYSVFFSDDMEYCEIEQYAFSGKVGFTAIRLPKGVKSIDQYAFQGSTLKVIIGASGSYAEEYANEYGFTFRQECDHANAVWVVTKEQVQCKTAGKKELHCPDCGAVLAKANIPAHELSDEWVVTVEATCGHSGEKAHLCSICGRKLKIETIPKLPHSGETYQKVVREATCDSTGVLGTFCKDCDLQLLIEYIPKTTHEAGEWEIEKEATCKEVGTRVKKCIHCHKVMETEAIPVIETGHVPGEWKVVKESTCAEQGVKELTCTLCGEIIYRVPMDLAPHKGINVAPIKAATCTEEGYGEGVCDVCGKYVYDIAIPTIPHNGFWIVTKPMTCTEPGEKELRCTECNILLDTAILEPSHTIGKFEITIPATCRSKGLKEQKCAVCGEVLASEFINPVKHQAGEGITVKEATCENDGLKEFRCVYCNKLMSTEVVDKHGHKEEKIVKSEPTCQKNGLVISKCTVCGHLFDANLLPKTSHKSGEFEVTKEATCTEKGLKEQKCTVCGEVLNTEEIPVTEHILGEWEILKEATASENGEKVQRCTVCNEVINTEEIPAIKAPVSFPDVSEEDWYNDAVNYAVEKGFFKGYEDGTFGPDNNIIRQDFAVVMAKAAGADLENQSTDNLKFNDIDKDAYYAKALAWCVENGIISGYSNGNFGSADNITREQICVMIYNYMTKVKGVKDELTTEQRNELLSKFTDGNEVSEWAQNAVAWSINNKVISGANGGKEIQSGTNANRAQTATIFTNMSKNGLL